MIRKLNFISVFFVGLSSISLSIGASMTSRHTNVSAPSAVKTGIRKAFGDYTNGPVFDTNFINYRNDFFLHRVGKGIDVTQCGLSAYESLEIQYDVFDREFLGPLYLNKGEMMQPSVNSLHLPEKAYSFESLYRQIQADTHVGASISASLPYLEADASSSFGFSTSCKLSDSETSFIYNLRTAQYLFDYELPSFGANKNLFLQHLSQDYLDDLSRAIMASNRGGGLSSYFALFEKYGTHILWKGGYGGACDITYAAHSKSVN